jgi:asparagine synthase (glutamine-hydrolysing)
MAHSIEGRVPFLDNDLVEFCARVPSHLKIRNGVEKYLLKKATAAILPRETVQRKKQRFTTPVDRFFGPRLLRVCNRLFEEENPVNEAFFRKESLLDILNFHKRPSYRLVLRHHRLLAQFYARQVWSLLTLHLWYKTVVERVDCGYLFEP